MKERNEISGYFNAFNNLPCHEWLKYNSIIAVVLTFVDLWLGVWFSILVRCKTKKIDQQNLCLIKCEALLMIAISYESIIVHYKIRIGYRAVVKIFIYDFVVILLFWRIHSCTMWIMTKPFKILNFLMPTF